MGEPRPASGGQGSGKKRSRPDRRLVEAARGGSVRAVLAILAAVLVVSSTVVAGMPSDAMGAGSADVGPPRNLDDAEPDSGPPSADGEPHATTGEDGPDGVESGPAADRTERTARTATGAPPLTVDARPNRTVQSLTAPGIPNATVAWRTTTNASGLRLAARADDRLYAVTEAGDLSALDRTTGETVWSRQLGTPTFPDGVTVANGTIVANLDNDQLVGIDAREGDLQWRYGVNDSEYVRSPVPGEGTLFVPVDDRVAALWAENGTVRWSRSGRVDELARADGTVYATADEWVAALSPATGATLWNTSVPRGYATSFTVTDDTVYSLNGGLVALDADTGERRWGPIDAFYGNDPVVGDDLVGFVDSGNVTVVDATDGTVLRQLSTGFARPVVAGNGRLVATVIRDQAANDVLAVGADRGEIRWRVTGDGSGREPGATDIGDPADVRLEGDTVSLVVSPGQVLGLNVSDGTTQWRASLGGEATSRVSTDGRLFATVGGDAVALDIPNLTIAPLDRPAPSFPGGNLTTNATVENLGDAPVSERVRLVAREQSGGAPSNGTTVANRTVRLAPGEARTVKLRWQTAAADLGRYDLTVRAGRATRRTVGAVEGPVDLSVSVPDVVDAGTFPVATATVENRRDRPTTRPVELRVDGRVVERRTVSLPPGSTDRLGEGLDVDRTDAPSMAVTAVVDGPADTRETRTVTVARDDGWSGVGYGPRKRGTNPEARGITADEVGVLWSRPVRTDTDTDTDAVSPVVAGDVYSLTDDGVVAVDPDTNDTRWRTAIDGRVRRVLVTGGEVVAASGDQLTALDATDGDVAWRHRLSERVGANIGRAVAPTVANRTAFLTLSSGGVLAIGTDDGDRRYRAELPVVNDGDQVYAEGPVAVGNGSVYVKTSVFESSRGALYALEEATGRVRWRLPTERGGGAPVVGNGTVYAATEGGEVLAVDAADGTVEWRAEGIGRGSEDDIRLALANRTVYVTSRDGGVWALDARTGEYRWTAGDGLDIESAPVVVNGTVYVTSVDSDFDSVYAYDAANGTTRWSYRTDGIPSAPAVADGKVFAVDNDGRLLAFAPADEVPSLSATVSVTPTTATAGDPVDLTVDSLGGSATVERFEWSFGDGTSATGRNVSHTYDDPGGYTATLRAVTELTSYVRTVDVTVIPAGSSSPATAGVSVSPDNPVADRPVRFQATDVAGADRIEAFRWRFGDGARAAGRTVAHTYDDSGTYDTELRLVTETGTVTIERRVSVSGTPTGGAGEPGSPDGEGDPTAARITSVSTSPAAAVPEGLQIVKQVTVEVADPSATDRVTVSVAGDRYVDREPVDGAFAVEVPVEEYGPGTTATVASTGPNGTDTATRGLGIADTGRFGGYLISQGTATVLPDGIKTSIRFPPAVLPSDVGFSTGLFSAEFGAEGSISLGVNTVKGTVSLGGGFKITVAITPLGGEGKGTITATLDARGGDPQAAFEFSKVEGSGSLKAGVSPEIGPKILGYGVTFKPFFGPFLQVKEMIWSSASGFPTDPDSVTSFLGLELSGELATGFPAGKIKGQATGTVKDEFDFPADFGRVRPTGKLVLKGILQFIFQQQEFTYTIVDGPVPGFGSQSVGTQAPRPGRLTELGERTLQPQRGGVPGSTTGENGVATASLDDVERLTADGYADESPSLVATEGGYLLTWTRQTADRTVTEGQELYLRSADGDGRFADRVRVTTDARQDVAPDVATNGTGGGLLAWTRLNRSFAGTATVPVGSAYAAQRVAVAPVTLNGSDGVNGAGSGGPVAGEPTLLAAGNGTAYRPRVGHAGGTYYLAWRYDADGDPTTADRGVRVASYHASTGTLGPVETIPGARKPRLAGDRLAYFRSATTGGTDGTVVVRNLTTGTRTSRDVAALSDLAVTDRTAVWVAGLGPNASVSYLRADGTVGRVDTAGVRAVRDVELIDRYTATGERVDILTFRGRVPENGTPGAAVRYRIRRGDAWTPSRRLVSNGDDLTYAFPTTAGRDGGFVSVLTGENVTSPTEQPDLFAVRHDYGVDVNVTATASPTPAEPSESVTVAYEVRNEGAVTARNLTLTVRGSNDTRTTADLSPVAPGGTTAGTVNLTAAGARTLRVTGDADGEELEPNDDTTILRVAWPVLRVSTATRRPMPGGGVAYDVRVRNDGPVAASNVSLRVTNAGQTVRTTTVHRVPANGSTTATVRLRAGDAVTTAPTQLRVRAPLDGPVRSEVVNQTTARTAIQPPRPDAFVVEDLIGPAETTACDPTATVGPATDDEAVCLLVGNRGPVGTNATVAVTAGGVETATQRVRLPAAPPNGSAYRSVAVDVGGLGAGLRERVTVRVRTASADAKPVDNAAGYRVDTAVVAQPFPDGVPRVSDLPPTDPDADGRYEDVDGDRAVTYADVVALFRVFEADRVRARGRLFDYGDDGQLDYTDLVALFEAVQD
jgi:outer membrane protein assembly factor BamB